MKKITIINGEFHEEEIPDSPKKVTDADIPGIGGTTGILIFGGTGGEMSPEDSERFRRLWYEATPTPERTVTQLWATVENSPPPTLDSYGNWVYQARVVNEDGTVPFDQCST